MRPVIRRAALAVAAVAVIVVLLAQPWRPSAQSFRESDPSGYSACTNFEQGDGAGGDVRRTLMARAASEGLHSTNDRIRATIDDANSDPAVTNLGDFRSACKAAGYRFG